jgi:hypothetical protein
MTPGVNLDAMNRLSIEKISTFLNDLASDLPQSIKLFEWVREKIAWATTETVYGPKNPFRDPDILTQFG